MEQFSSPLPAALWGKPEARALVRGDAAHASLMGEVLFYPWLSGTLVLIRATGLPGSGFLGFHIHTTGDCCTGGDVPFHCAGGHFDPTGAMHPNHAGDLPVLLSAGGNALMLVYTDRFRPADVVDRAVILHDMPDDYRSQPAGDSGGRIGCGAIEAV